MAEGDGSMLTQGPPGLMPISKSIDPSLDMIPGSQPFRERFDRGMDLALSFGPGAIRAWQGTPHTFSEYSNAAIGSGQGAQTYGYGHYVAGNKATGEYYQQELAGMPRWMYNDPEIGNNTIPNHLKGLDWEKKLPGAEWSTEDLAKYNGLKQFDTWVPPYSDLQGDKLKDFYMNHRQIGESAKNWLNDNQQHLSIYQPGHLLEVHVKPEEHELLDWDQPFSMQEPGIQDKIRSLYDKLGFSHSELTEQPGRFARTVGGDSYQIPPVPEPTGQDIHYKLSNTLGLEPQDVSKTIHEAGIPGIKYLDQGSRNLPPGHPDITHNYVIFDQSNLKIQSRDGIPMTPVEGDPFASAR